MKFVETSTVELVTFAGSDRAIVDAATVSTGVNPSDERIRGLIGRLMKDRHGSPFEMVWFRVNIECPLFTARQLMRHRIASYNEQSARYSVMDGTFYVPPLSRPVAQVEGSKPMDYELQHNAALSELTRSVLTKHSRDSWRRYDQLLQMGVVREVARMVLPTNIMTRLTMGINLRSAFNLMSLRGSAKGMFPSHPQYEFTVVSDLIEEQVSHHCPIALTAFNEHGRVAP